MSGNARAAVRSRPELTHDAMAEAVVPDIGELTDLGAGYGQAVLAAQKEWLAGLSRIQNDYLAFFGERVRKDFEIVGRMAECRDVEAAMALQTAFIETAREDYLDSAQRFWTMGQELTQSCAEHLTAVTGRPGGTS